MFKKKCYKSNLTFILTCCGGLIFKEKKISYKNNVI